LIGRVAIVGFALLLAAAQGSAPHAGGEGGLSVAPEMTLPDVQGKPYKIAWADAKATLVNFWAVWCVPCQDEIPQISDLVTEYKGRGFRAVGIAVESGDAAAVRSFIAESPELGVNYPVVIGNLDALIKYGNIDAIPTTFLVDSRGKVHKSYFGATPGFGKAVSADLEALLAKAGNDGAPAPEASPKGAGGD
jgi:thiol-disulfide isomerase/thioredoxin